MNRSRPLQFRTCAMELGEWVTSERLRLRTKSLRLTAQPRLGRPNMWMICRFGCEEETDARKRQQTCKESREKIRWGWPTQAWIQDVVVVRLQHELRQSRRKWLCYLQTYMEIKTHIDLCYTFIMTYICVCVCWKQPTEPWANQNSSATTYWIATHQLRNAAVHSTQF